MKTRRIAYHFEIPAEPESVSKHCESCCQNALRGEYAYTSNPTKLEPGKVILDIGSCLGAFSVWAYGWFDGVEKIYAYEPNIEAVEISRRNCSYIPFEVTHAGVSSYEGELYFNLKDNWGASCTTSVAGNHVPVPKVHPFNLPPCDIFKCDAEGAEKDIFTHYQHWDDVRVVLFEDHLGQRKHLMDFMYLKGFSLWNFKMADDCDQGVHVWKKR